jgi:hypothetical protein
MPQQSMNKFCAKKLIAQQATAGPMNTAREVRRGVSALRHIFQDGNKWHNTAAEIHRGSVCRTLVEFVIEGDFSFHQL